MKGTSLDLANMLRSPLRGELLAPTPARIAIEEMQALNLDAEVIAPEHADFQDDLVAQFRAPPTSGDHLRMPPPKNLTGQQISRSMMNVLAGGELGSNNPDAAIAEAKMRRVLEVLDSAQRAIRQSSSSRA
jgi:hypothetical protein